MKKIDRLKMKEGAKTRDKKKQESTIEVNR